MYSISQSAVVQAQRIGPPVQLDQLLHEPDRPLTRDRGGHLDAEPFSIAIVQHIQRTEPAPVVERVVREVERSHDIQGLRGIERQRLSRRYPALISLSTAITAASRAAASVGTR